MVPVATARWPWRFVSQVCPADSRIAQQDDLAYPGARSRSSSARSGPAALGLQGARWKANGYQVVVLPDSIARKLPKLRAATGRVTAGGITQRPGPDPVCGRAHCAERSPGHCCT